MRDRAGMPVSVPDEEAHRRGEDRGAPSTATHTHKGRWDVGERCHHPSAERCKSILPNAAKCEACFCTVLNPCVGLASLSRAKLGGGGWRSVFAGVLAHIA